MLRARNTSEIQNWHFAMICMRVPSLARHPNPPSVPSCVLIIPLTPLPLDPKVSQSQRRTSESAFISHRRRRAKPPGSPAVCSVGSGCTGLAEWECFAVWCVKQCWQIPTRTGRYFFYASVGGMCRVIFDLFFLFLPCDVDFWRNIVLLSTVKQKPSQSGRTLWFFDSYVVLCPWLVLVFSHHHVAVLGSILDLV